MCEDYFYNNLYLYKRKVKTKKRLSFVKPKVNVFKLVLFFLKRNKIKAVIYSEHKRSSSMESISLESSH